MRFLIFFFFFFFLTFKSRNGSSRSNRLATGFPAGFLLEPTANGSGAAARSGGGQRSYPGGQRAPVSARPALQPAGRREGSASPSLCRGDSLGGRRRGQNRRQKATKKTDKPRPEEKDDLDITEMSNEDLKEQLVKYGMNPGPIVATTRKLYEKKLLKLMEQGPELKEPVPLPAITTTENTRQNGNSDSDQYSDNEEDPKTELRLEKREPLKARTKTPVALKQKRVVEHNQVVNRVPGNFKHAAPTLSISELSDMPRRTPKKPLMTAEVLERTATEERVERDILKEMFPYEASTPTGISASCRRPIKGAASRPIEHSDFRMDESFSKYVEKYGTSADIKSEKLPTKKERSIPLWIKVLLFVVVSVFLFLVYQSMETNQGNPFSKYLNIVSPGSAK
ncbi:thymopoietin isoform X5 [Manacus candei]|uniref:thymopoietin isoform X5 n=1 Tax=Manacus candei TaxID=415023 RepID=UPI0022276675|nr:thymopoietin isoform X5 [Manacus candei]